MANVETKFLNERVVVEIRFANEIVDFPFSIRSRPSSGLDHGGSLKIKMKVNSNSDFHFIVLIVWVRVWAEVRKIITIM